MPNPAGRMPALPTIDVEAAVFPREDVGEAAEADVFAVAEGLEETDGGEDIRSWKIWWGSCVGSAELLNDRANLLND